MLADTKIQLLQQAQAAQAVGNWTEVTQCLQQLALVDIEPEASQVLDLALTVLDEGDFHQRWDMAKVFPCLGANAGIGIERAIAPLIEIVTSNEQEEELRWYTARILGEFAHPKAIAALVDLLKSTGDEELVSMAASALGQIGNPAVEALSELLVNETTRLIAVKSLAHIRRSEIIAPLLTVVEDLDANIRAMAIEALGSFHHSEIAPVLLNALNDVAAPVRKEAVTGLGFRSDLTELDLVDKLIPRLYDFNIDVCSAAVTSLGRLGSDRAAEAIDALLNSPTPTNLQLECIRALGRLETPLSLQYLRSCLNEASSPTLQQEAVKVLGQVEQLKAIAGDTLLEALQLSNSLTSAIALSLGRLGEHKAIEPLIRLLANSDTGVRLHAIAALQQLAPTQAYQQLQQLNNNDVQINYELKQGIEFALHEWQQT